MKRFFNKAMLWRMNRNNALALVFLTVLGPFATYNDFNVFVRIAYWAVLLTFCGLVFEAFIPGFLSNPRLARRLSRWPRFALGVLCASFVAMWGVYVVEFVARGPMPLAHMPWLFICVVAVGTVMGFVNFMPPFAKVASAPKEADINFERIAFFETYPHLKGSRILWITMEDHYARVVLDSGEVSLHASMRELEKLLLDYPGMRIHRSHWVANEAMRSITRNGRAMEVDVGSSTKLPLGGTYRAQAERVFAEMTSA